MKKSTSAYERPQPHACFIQQVDDDLVGYISFTDILKAIHLAKPRAQTDSFDPTRYIV